MSAMMRINIERYIREVAMAVVCGYGKAGIEYFAQHLPILAYDFLQDFEKEHTPTFQAEM